MNEHLDRLAQSLGKDTDLDRLVDALYAVRAPRDVEGIVPVCRQFQDWRHAYPDLRLFPELADYAERLAVLDRIADLDMGDDHLMDRTISWIKNPWTPLYKVTGDSVIGELLLVRSGERVAAADFERASVWLLRQAQHFHVKNTSRSAYQTYATSDAGRLATHLPGRRLYEAYEASSGSGSSGPARREENRRQATASAAGRWPRGMAAASTESRFGGGCRRGIVSMVGIVADQARG